jgi:hypothetical protein
MTPSISSDAPACGGWIDCHDLGQAWITNGRFHIGHRINRNDAALRSSAWVQASAAPAVKPFGRLSQQM